MIIVAVVSIFLFSSGMSKRVELNRAMQENIKNVVEDIAEWVRISWVNGVVDIGQTQKLCNFSSSGSDVSGFKICLNSWVDYVLWYHDGSDWWSVSSFAECLLPSDTDIITKHNCRILKRNSEFEDYYPLSNSFVAFEEVEFLLTNTDIPKLTMIFRIRPSYDKWLSREIIENNTMILQSTVSERLIKTQ